MSSNRLPCAAAAPQAVADRQIAEPVLRVGLQVYDNSTTSISRVFRVRVYNVCTCTRGIFHMSTC